MTAIARSFDVDAIVNVYRAGEAFDAKGETAKLKPLNDAVAAFNASVDAFEKGIYALWQDRPRALQLAKTAPNTLNDGYAQLSAAYTVLHESILTAMSPFQHGVIDNIVDRNSSPEKAVNWALSWGALQSLGGKAQAIERRLSSARHTVDCTNDKFDRKGIRVVAR
jgi:hypothetical protein